MDLETVRIGTVENQIAEVVINQPKKLNALNSLVLTELIAAFEEVEKDDGVRVVIFRGEGGRAFIAGADIAEMSRMSPLDFREFSLKLRGMARILINSSRPVIAAVKGYTFGGGNILCMHCDFAFATENSSFGQQEITLGILGGMARMIHLVGNRRAWDIMMTGRIIKAKEAEEIGLITRCLPEKGFDEFVLNYARKLVGMPLVATKLAKKLKAISEKVDLESAYEYENELISLCFDSPETKERMEAFVNKSKG